MEPAIRNALALYDARRDMGIPEGRALYSTAAGYAAAMDLTRDNAARIIRAALDARANPIGPVFP